MIKLVGKISIRTDAKDASVHIIDDDVRVCMICARIYTLYIHGCNCICVECVCVCTYMSFLYMRIKTTDPGAGVVYPTGDIRLH